ncbi:hypothetical protein BDM02DRAFT_3156000 [Thelephora ganbajun]|uniref:Uncharacterized protein n=1 Tax=Thelephora ganbajun TaxID=370292 RepID=A0ACB6ZE37_THEGA|nr:hypothetical protein BDM02DRAFT_3156000 [Thelephora ganbajun]
MQVTVSFLPVKLSLVRIPRARLHKFYHPLLRQILSPKHTFLNVTCNELELSILAESQVLEDFESVAENDRKKRSRSPSRDSDSSQDSRSLSPPIIEDWDCVEVCHESWNVLQIDSHSDGIDKSGARVHELSAPLAEAGISILYLSSYLCDFILVKSTRVQEVINLMVGAGFDLYPSADGRLMSSSPLPTPTSPEDDTTSTFDLDFHSSATSTVITRSRTSSRHHSPKVTELESSTSPGQPSPSFGTSTSFEDTEVTVLDPDLTCVGLSEDSADVWALKIVKLVAFPDLILDRSRSSSRKNSVAKDAAPTVGSTGIPTPDSSEDEADDKPVSKKNKAFASSCVTPMTFVAPTRKQTSSSTRDGVSFFSFTRTEEGSSLTTDVSIVSSLFPPNERHMLICTGDLSEGEEDPDCDCSSPQLTGPLKCLQIDLRKFGLEKHGLVNRYSQVLEENGINHMYSSTFKTANLLVRPSLV